MERVQQRAAGDMKQYLSSEALMFDQLRGDVDEIHQGRLQGAAHLPGGVTLHGLRRALPATLGGHLRMKVCFRWKQV